MADGTTFPGRPRTVVGFAGGGGSSVALMMATGKGPDACFNHWMVAVDAHRRHFPMAEHYCADAFDVDPRTCLPGEEIAFGWFSPDCTDFSKAKGKAPRSERIRGLAWSVIPWAKLRRIKVIMLENVEEFAQWGPVHRTGPKAGEPIPSRRGETFRRWKSRLEKIGYVVEWRVLNAADYGAPTTRKRLYLVARCDGQPIVWPERTHAPRKDAERLGLKPWVGACEIIDWRQDCPSIFLTPAEVEELRQRTGKRVQRPLVAATQKRIARGMERYVIGSADPFLVNITQRTWAKDRAHGVRDPLPTLTSSRGGEYALASAALASVAHGGEARAWPVEDPTRTQTGHHDKALVTGCLVPAYGERDGQPPRCLDVEEPAATVVPGGNGGRLVAGSLVRTNFHSAAARNGIRSAEEPMATSTGDGGIGVLAASLHQMNTRDVGGEAVDPARTQAGREHVALQGAHLVRQFGTSTAADAAGPVPTIMPEGAGKTSVATAYMAQGNFGMLGRGCCDPVTTVMGRGTQQQIVSAHLDAYYSSGKVGGAANDPARTSTGRGRLSLVASWLEQANTDMVGHELPAPVSTIVGKGCTQRLIEARLELDGGAIGRRAHVLEFLWSHFGVPTAEEWADPAATLAGRLKFGLVLIDGAVWMIVDIGLRMLTPGELAAAMGLPPGFDLTHDIHGRPISKTHQTQMIGNMVSPPPAEALIAANCPELIMPDHRRAA